MTNLKTAFLQDILENGKRFAERYIDRYNRQAILTHWYCAFEFFLDHACFQGRLDSISQRVRNYAGRVLEPYFTGNDKDRWYIQQVEDGWATVKRQLGESIGRGKIGRGSDIEMIVSALDYLGRIGGKNIVAHSALEIKRLNIMAHYHALQRRKSPQGIYCVGPKVAAFYLRDVVSLLGLAEFVGAADAFCLQPVDVWVQRVAEELAIVEPGTPKETTQKAIAEMCRREGIPPIQFNQGAWYTGFHVLKLGVQDKSGGPGAAKPCRPG